MVIEASEPRDEGVIDVSDVLEQIREREEAGIYPKMPTVEERMKAQGTRPFASVDDIPRADFEFDVDEFLRLIYEGRNSE